MTQFLEQAKKAYWRAGRKVTPDFLAEAERLLLENLSVLGEITEDDRQWARSLVKATFPGY